MWSYKTDDQVTRIGYIIGDVFVAALKVRIPASWKSDQRMRCRLLFAGTCLLARER